MLDRPGGAAAVQVDAPCAGVRSLWSAGVFLFAAACVEQRRLDRWFGAAVVVTGGLLLAANTLRVATLVVLGAVLDAPEIASAVHVPLGLLGFAWAAAAGWLVLRQGPVATIPTGATALSPAEPRPVPGLAPLLAACLVALTTFAPAPPAAPAAALPFTLALPQVLEGARFAATPIAPIPAELEYFAGVDVPPPAKWRFTAVGSANLAGTLLVVPSRAWRAHHLPSACLLGQGHTVEGPWTVAIAPSFDVRVARVDDGAATAVWWFQAPGRTTEDLSVRTWAALSGAEDRWVLVSMLLEGSVAPLTLGPLVRALHRSVHFGLDPTAQEAACAPSEPS